MSARLLVREGQSVVERPPADLSELRDRPCWLDLVAPSEADLQLVADELGLHPLAVEDALQTHERPKLEQYADHYFLVFYALESPDPDVVDPRQFAVFMLKNVVVTVHAEEFSACAAVEKRWREGRLQTSGLLLHALLDTVVDQYFDVVAGFGDRVELLESLIVERSGETFQTSLRELFLLKRDLLAIRRLVAPEREILAALVRGDIAELRESGRRAYYQDVSDHILRVIDEIDSFRELTSSVIDAHLAAASNRLNEVLKVLTSVATILLVLTFVTGFFGQNFTSIIPFESPELFWGTVAFMAVVVVLLALAFRRRGWL